VAVVVSGGMGAAIAVACSDSRPESMIAQRQPALAIESTE
jgi:hypothetical protein